MLAVRDGPIIFDTDSVVVFQGQISRYDWTNPHSYIFVEVLNDNGETTEWQLETDATPILQRNGWTPESLEPGDLFFALTGENFDGNRFVGEAFSKGAVAAVTTVENEAGPCVTVDDPLQALQHFAARHREHFEIPVIAITGSCGKTSSKDLIAAVLQTRYQVVKTKGSLNNEIGLPLSLLEIDSDTEAAVLEMGANHLGEIAHLCTIAKPTEAAITLIAEAHLEGFGSLDDVAKAKSEVVFGLTESGLFYLNVEDPNCVKIANEFHGRTICFGGDTGIALESCAFNEAPHR